MRSYLCLLGLIAAAGVRAHPSGLAFGRSSCGAEFHSPEDAYMIADATEAWYLRRIQTCEQPFFWTTFTTDVANQDILTSVISPEIARFQDKLKFKGVIFGAGLPELTNSEIAGLPEGVRNWISNGDGGIGTTGFIIEKEDDDYAKCSFVDNFVMKNFCDVESGTDGKKRALELLELDADYKDPVKAGATWRSWWLYSKDQVFPTPGTYSMVTWLEDRSTGKLARGKYEITIAPHVWYAYADAPTTAAAHEQITTCTCGGNGLLYNEQYPERIGMQDKGEVFAAEVPNSVCEDEPEDVVEKCFAAIPKVDINKAMEWGGEFTLAKGTYTWTLKKEGSVLDEKVYHEPQMDIFVTRVPTGSTIDSYHGPAERQMMKTQQKVDVKAGGDIIVDVGKTQTLINDPDSDVSVFNIVVDEAAVYAIFTQHLPAEFAATYLENTDQDVPMDAHYVFPQLARDYVLGDTPSGAALERAREEGMSGREPPGWTMEPDKSGTLTTGTQVGIVMGVIVVVLAAAAFHVLTFKDQGDVANNYENNRNTQANPEFDNPVAANNDVSNA